MNHTHITITVPKKERSDDSRSTITPSFKRGLTCQGTGMKAVSVKDLAKELIDIAAVNVENYIKENKLKCSSVSKMQYATSICINGVCK